MASLVGVNGSGLPLNIDNMNAYTTRIDSAWVLSLNEPKITSPHNLIYRVKRKDSDDDNQLLTDDLEALQTDVRRSAAIRHAEAPAGALLEDTNEPYLGRLDLLNLRTLYFSDACAALGRKAAILHISEGNPRTPPLDVQNDWLALEPCIRHNAELGGVLAHHDYGDPFNVAQSLRFNCGRWQNPVVARTGTKVVISEMGLIAGWDGLVSPERYVEIIKAYLEMYNVPICIFSWGYWVK